MDPILASRLESLEKRSKFLTGLVVTLVVYVFLISGGKIESPVHAQGEKVQEFDIIRAKRIEVISAEGRMVLAPSLISLYAKEGNAGVSISMNKDNPSVCLYDKAGKGRVDMMISNDNPIFSISGKTDKSEVCMTVCNNNPSFTVRDKTGKDRVILSTAGTSSSFLICNESGASNLLVYTSDVSTNFSIGDAAGSVILSTTNNSPSIGLYDSKKKNIFTAP